ncbi:MAG: cytochrome c [Zetaproteobacteria bacterium]|nr:MAG: cytochrome c [Zetaproteobacteria bacterium]
MLLVLLSGCNQQSPAVPAYPEMTGEGFKTFAEHCSACHAPPKPTTHTAREWPSVIARMQQHRIQRGLGAMPAADMVKIKDYLLEYARSEDER